MSYRDQEGWTTEQGLVTGEGSTVQDIKQVINSSIILSYEQNNQLIVCIALGRVTK